MKIEKWVFKPQTVERLSICFQGISLRLRVRPELKKYYDAGWLKQLNTVQEIIPLAVTCIICYK